jgi:hypothetical protein
MNCQVDSMACFCIGAVVSQKEEKKMANVEKFIYNFRWCSCTSHTDRRQKEHNIAAHEAFASFTSEDFTPEVCDVILRGRNIGVPVDFTAVYKCGCEIWVRKESDLPRGAEIIGTEAEKKGEEWAVRLLLSTSCFECGALEKEALVNPALNQEEWVHSLDAYSGWGAEDILEHGMDLCAHPEWEICCSESGNPVGQAAIILKGTVTGLWNYDCASYIGKHGKRVNSRSRFIGDNVEWSKEVKGSYAEAWVKDIIPQRMIVTENLLRHPDRLDAVKVVARRNNLLVYLFKDGREMEAIYDPGCDIEEVFSGAALNVARGRGYMEGWI